MSQETTGTIEGMVLNHRYQVEAVFNDKGGMGLIYRGIDLNLRGTVILKKSRFVDEQSRAAFEREARLLYGLRHNALPRVIDYFIAEDGGQFFVMEFIPGQDLSEMLTERIEKSLGPFTFDTVLEWGDQLMDALHYLHTHQPPIIHRDIKPQNLKVMPNGQIILLDFGLAKGAVSGMTLGSASIQGYTPNYAPLEQMRGSGTDARSDIYSLAVTMHCLLTGQMPPDAVSRAIDTLSAQPDPLRPIHEINPKFPMAISEALQRASSLNQNERPPTALAMRETLREARAKARPTDSGILSELTFNSYPQHPAQKPSEPVASFRAAASYKNNVGDPAAVTPLVVESAQVVAIPSAHEQKEKGAPVVAEAPLPSVKRQKDAPKSNRAGTSVPPNSTQAKSGRQMVDQAVAWPSDAVRTNPPSGAFGADGDPFDTIPDPIADEALLAELVAQAPALQTTPSVATDAAQAASKSAEMRPTSLVFIEHKDDGKPVENNAAEPVEAAASKPQPDVSSRSKAQSGINKSQSRTAPPTPVAFINDPPPRSHRSRPSSQPVFQRTSQVAEPSIQSFISESEPPPEVEKPSQGDKLPNIDLTGIINNPTVAGGTPKGMRSYTEVIALNVRLEMHAIPGGEFLMGSPDQRGYADEYPQHRVTLSPFYIGKYPITQSQWRAVMRTNPSHFIGNNHPIDSVTWDEAIEFCRRLSYATGRLYRLPSEAEWEFACRASTYTQFNYGDEEELLSQYAWSLVNSSNHTHPVGEKKPNGWGLYDMHGNVWEWCQDWYSADYYSHSSNVNPAGSATGTSRILRGGSWYSLPNYCRSAGRSNHQPDLRDPLVGFRVVGEAKA